MIVIVQKHTRQGPIFSLNLIELSIFGIFICIAAGLRFVLLFQNIDYDEAYTYLTYVSQGYFSSWSTYNLPNNHIFNSIVSVFSTQLFGARPEVLRFFPLIFGVCSLPVFYYLLKKFFQPKIAAMAAVVSWCSYALIQYSAQARGYSSQVFFFYLSLVLFLYGTSRWMMFFSIVCMSLALLSVPTTIFALMIFAFVFLLRQREDFKKILFWGIKIGLLTAFWYLPAMIYVLTMGTKTFGFKEKVTFEIILGKVENILLFFHPTESMTMIMAELTLCLFGLVLASRRTLTRPLSVGLLITLPALVLVYPSALVFERLWIWIIPIFFAFVFQGFYEITQWGISEKASRQILLIFFVTFGAMTITTSYQKSHVSSLRYENTSESLYDDLVQILKPGDFLAVSQSLVTELNYWSFLHGKKNGFSRYLIDGDWSYSFYRQSADAMVLQKHFGQNRIFLISHVDEQIHRGLQLSLNYLNLDTNQRWTMSDLQVNELNLKTKKANISEVILKR